MNILLVLSLPRAIARTLLVFGIIVPFLCLCCSPLFAESFYNFAVASEPYTMLPENPLGIKPGEGTAGISLDGEWLSMYGEKIYPNSDDGEPDNLLQAGGFGFLRLSYPDYEVVVRALSMHLGRLDERSGVHVGYSREGGEYILKTEWRYAGIVDTPDLPDDYINFQIWIYQKSGVVEFHYGPSNVGGAYGALIGGGPFVGLSVGDKFPPFAVFTLEQVWGEPVNPQFDYQLVFPMALTGIPPEGTVYRFTPSVPSGVPDPTAARAGYRLYPNPTSGRVTIEASEKFGRNARVRLVDLLGTTVDEFGVEASASSLDLILPQPGVYYCRITNGDGTTRVYSVVRR